MELWLVGIWTVQLPSKQICLSSPHPNQLRLNTLSEIGIVLSGIINRYTAYKFCVNQLLIIAFHSNRKEKI